MKVHPRRRHSHCVRAINLEEYYSLCTGTRSGLIGKKDGRWRLRLHSNVSLRSLVLLRGSGDRHCAERGYIKERICIRIAVPRQRHDIRQRYVTEKICTRVAVPCQQHDVRRGRNMNKSLSCKIFTGNKHLLIPWEEIWEHRHQMIC